MDGVKIFTMSRRGRSPSDKVRIKIKSRTCSLVVFEQDLFPSEDSIALTETAPLFNQLADISTYSCGGGQAGGFYADKVD